MAVSHAWSRPAPAGGVGVVYLTVTNRGARDDALVGAVSTGAKAVSLHETRRVGAITSMRALAALPIPAGRTVTLAPGGAHLMMDGLVHPLRLGDKTPVTLIFSHAGRLGIEAPVSASAPDAGPGMRM